MQKNSAMPTLLITFGMRFFFYLDEHQPIHVHVDCNGKKAKIALEPMVCLVYNHGLKEQELKGYRHLRHLSRRFHSRMA